MMKPLPSHEVARRTGRAEGANAVEEGEVDVVQAGKHAEGGVGGAVGAGGGRHVGSWVCVWRMRRGWGRGGGVRENARKKRLRFSWFERGEATFGEGKVNETVPLFFFAPFLRRACLLPPSSAWSAQKW